MRSRTVLALAAVAASVVALRADAQPAQSPQPNPNIGPPDASQLLGTIVVVGDQAQRPLPKIGVLPSLSSDLEDVTLRAVVRRDLDLSGEFEVISDAQAPEGLYLSDSPVDIKAWQAKGAEAVVKVTGKPLPGGKAELRGLAYYLSKGADPVFDKRFEVDAKHVREEAHRVADVIIGALTGRNGGFASHMTFVSGSGKTRSVYTIDSDGHDVKAVSPQDALSLAPTFARGEELHHTISVKNSEFKIMTPKGVVQTNVPGSVYGIAWNKDRSKVAVSIGRGAAIQVFLGSDYGDLQLASQNRMAMQPTFTPSGKLAFVGEGKWGQRVFVDDKPISPDGLMASSPTFCNHPDGVRAVFAVGVGKNTDLVASAEKGGGMVRLTQGQGSNGYPSCSPDGRLVAFFSTRKQGEGPGLYVMRVDGGRPKRISPMLGESLRWDPLPARGAVAAAAAK